MTDDLVERARHNANADMPHHASVSLIGQMADRIEELEAENKRLNEQMDAIEEMGTESLNALPDCLMRLAPALVENDELKAKLAKAMEVVEMIASADVDAVLGQAVDLSCEIIGELMEDEDDEY